MKEKNGDEGNKVQFERFDKLLKKKKITPPFEQMSPYEILNYLRDKEVRDKYKVLPSNRLFKKFVVTFTAAVFFVVTYVNSGGNEIVRRNVELFVNKVGNKKAEMDMLEKHLEYIIQGDFKTLIEGYRSSSNLSYEDQFELVTMLSSIRNFSEAEQELIKLKNKLEQNTFVKNEKTHNKNIYKMIDQFILLDKLDVVKSILDKHRNVLGQDVLFLQREIIYLLLSKDKDAAIDIYTSIDIDKIQDFDSMLSYASLSFIFNRFDNAVLALDKALSIDFNNINILTIIDIISSYNVEELNKSLDFFIKKNPENERLKLIRARANTNDLSKTKANIEDLDVVTKVHVNELITKIVRLQILSNAQRYDEANILANDLKNIPNKTFEVYYALSKYNLDIKNFNDALNDIKQSIFMNEEFYGNYEVLYSILSNQNKTLNINYFYLKMKLLNLLNINIDYEFADKYINGFNNIDNAIEVLEFASRVSIYEPELRYKIAKLYIDKRKYNEAKENLYEAIALNQKSSYYRTLGVLLTQMGNTEEGIANIRKSYEIDPNDILNLNNAGAYYANVEKNVPRAFSNIKGAYEDIDNTYNDYEAFIIRENYFKLNSIYDEATGDYNEEKIPVIDYLY